MLRDNLLRRHLVEAGDEHPLKTEVDGAIVDRPHLLEESPYSSAIQRPIAAEEIEGERHVACGERLPVGPQHPLARGQAEHGVPFPPLPVDGQPWHHFRMNAVEYKEGLVDAGEGRPAGGGGGGEGVEVANPGRLLLLGNHEYSVGGSRRVPRTRGEGQGRRQGSEMRDPVKARAMLHDVLR